MTTTTFGLEENKIAHSAVLGVGVSTMLLKEACCEESAGEGLDTVVKVGGEATSLSHDPAA